MCICMLSYMSHSRTCVKRDLMFIVCMYGLWICKYIFLCLGINQCLGMCACLYMETYPSNDNSKMLHICICMYVCMQTHMYVCIIKCMYVCTYKRIMYACKSRVVGKIHAQTRMDQIIIIIIIITNIIHCLLYAEASVFRRMGASSVTSRPCRHTSTSLSPSQSLWTRSLEGSRWCSFGRTRPRTMSACKNLKP